MARAVLFDTDVLIDYAREVQVAVETVDRARQEAACGVSVITAMELLAGCRDKREQAALDVFLLAFALVHVDVAISERARQLMRVYRLSHGLRLPDAFIAASALVGGWTLLSKNQRDYRFINGLDLPPYPIA